EREAAANAVTDEHRATAVLPRASDTRDHQKIETLPETPPQNYDTIIAGPADTFLLESSGTQHISPSATEIFPSTGATAQQRQPTDSKTKSSKPTEIIQPPAKATEMIPPAPVAKPEARPAESALDPLSTDPFGQTGQLSQSKEKEEPSKPPQRPEAKTAAASSIKPTFVPAKASEPAHVRSRTPLFIGVGVLLLLLAALGAWFLGSGKENVETPLAKANPSPAATGEPDSSSASSQFPQSSAAPEGMVFVLDGVLQVGREDGKPNEAPAHVVTLKPFFIDRTEVTNEQYQKFVGQTGRPAPPSWTGNSIPAGAEQHPVTDVTWEDATAYAQWAGKRLPTEEEWEFAARGLNIKNLYPWGEDWRDDAANVLKDKNDKRQVMPVGQFPNAASPFGALDMIGNAWEWTSSDYREYPGGTAEPPRAGYTNLKVIRGGSYDTLGKEATATLRSGWPATRKDWPKGVQPDYSKTGFRLAQDAKSQ
ncbi:MAG: SUMF1/EgtB/PvdO family nonheme iron enzyme, partial [Acidobacteriota bacterium]